LAALEVLLDLCQEFGDELINGPAESIPRVALSKAEWLNFEDDPLVMTEAKKRAQSLGPAMSAMMVVLKMFQDHQGTYVSALIALRQALKEQLTWKKRACKNGKELRTAQNDIGGLMSALENRRQQFVRVVRERDANHEQIMQLTRERDDTLYLAQTRDNARIMTGIQAEVRENELLRQIEEL